MTSRFVEACTHAHLSPRYAPALSDVYPGIYKADGEPCAVKVINRTPLANTDALAQEVVILRSLSHPQVVR